VFYTGEVPIKLKEIEQMIIAADKNQDGKIDYMEFIEAMLNRPELQT
jgi:Ca2+-binding EF-hand superfamily protein